MDHVSLSSFLAEKKSFLVRNWAYTATLATFVALPVYLYKDCQRLDQRLKKSSTGTGSLLLTNSDSKNASASAIQRNRRMKHLTVSALAICGLSYLAVRHYPKPVEYKRLESLHSYHTLYLQTLLFWKYKVLQMAYFGTQYFADRHISSVGQTLLASLVPCNLIFKPNPNLKRDAAHALLDTLLHSIPLCVYGYILYRPGLDLPSISYPSKVLLMCLLSIGYLPIRLPLDSLVVQMAYVCSAGTGITSNALMVEKCYYRPLLSLNLHQWWKRWSLQLGIPLKRLFYSPLLSLLSSSSSSLRVPSVLKRAIATVVVYGVNCADHVFFSYMLAYAGHVPLKGYVQVMAVLGIATMIDAQIGRYTTAADAGVDDTYAKKGNTAQRSGTTTMRSLVVHGFRFALMYGSLYTALWFGADCVFPMHEMLEEFSLQNKQRTTKRSKTL